MKKTLIIVSSTVLVMISGFFVYQHYHNCGSQCGYDSKMSMVCEFSCAAKDADESKVVAQSKAHIGDYTKCPVSGVVIHVTNESPQIHYEGKSAYTCCETCAQIFNESPAKFAANIN